MRTRKRCCSSFWRRRAAEAGAVEDSDLVVALEAEGVPAGLEPVGAEARAAVGVCGKPVSRPVEAVVSAVAEGRVVAVREAAEEREPADLDLVAVEEAVGLVPAVRAEAEVGAVLVLEVVEAELEQV